MAFIHWKTKQLLSFVKLLNWVCNQNAFFQGRNMKLYIDSYDLQFKSILWWKNGKDMRWRLWVVLKLSIRRTRWHNLILSLIRHSIFSSQNRSKWFGILLMPIDEHFINWMVGLNVNFQDNHKSIKSNFLYKYTNTRLF